MPKPVTKEQVREFWENNPLFVGESANEPGTLAFFEEHRRVMLDDGYPAGLDVRMYPGEGHRDRVLDLGCGPGFWTAEFVKAGCQNVVGADLTQRALELAAARLRVYGLKAELRQEDAENLSFADGTFSHVNCQGVIHHSPRPQDSIREIARVLEAGGTASISVYYKNIFLRLWPGISFVGKVLASLGFGLRGRGREGMMRADSVEDLVRQYDGENNPLGLAFSKAEFMRLVEPHFRVDEFYLHHFPARALPFRIPRALHILLDRHAGFLIYASVTKR